MSTSPDRNQAFDRVTRRWNRLVKPPGSLGMLEEWVRTLSRVQHRDPPEVRPAALLLFAGDHGVVSEGVSAYPGEVTARMLRTVREGGAAVNVLCAWSDVELRWYNAGARCSLQRHEERIAPGSANLMRQPAMDESQVRRALKLGREAADEALSDDVVCLGLGEIGIGNTTATAALTAALLRRDPEEVVGPGSGLDDPGVRRKTRVVESALERHEPRPGDPVECLRRLGGLEIAALTGAVLEAADRRVPVVMDGVTTAAASLVARRINPEVSSVLIASHRSPEPAHGPLLEALDQRPMFDFQMRLGEGTGAVLAVPLLEAALSLYRGMSTLRQAGIRGDRP